MKFTAENDVEPLDYDFRPYVDAHGRVPEPTQDAMGAFLDFFDDLTAQNEKANEADLQAKANALTELQETAGKVTVIGDLPSPDVSADPEPDVDPEPEPEKRTWRKLILNDDDKAREFADQIAGLCQNQPTGDQIWALPPRVRRLFTSMAIDLFIFGKDDQGKAAAGTND